MGKTPRITVITPTIRPRGLRLVEESLKRQTFQDFEWLVTAPEHIKIKDINIDILLSDPPKNTGDYWSLNKAYNKAIRHSKGDLIVSWQDYTYADKDALERLFSHFQAHNNRLITTIGHKYDIIDPPHIDDEMWHDPRDNGTRDYEPCNNYLDIEYNFCSIPKQAFYDIGGYDEELDKYAGYDGVSISDRLHLLGGYEFWIDRGIRTYSLPHGRPPAWEENNVGHFYQEYRKRYIENPKLNYLS